MTLACARASEEKKGLDGTPGGVPTHGTDSHLLEVALALDVVNDLLGGAEVELLELS